MPELRAVVLRGADGWIRFEEAVAEPNAEAWVAADADTSIDVEAWR